MNKDNSFKASKQQASTGGVLKDLGGKWLGSFSFNIRAVIFTKAELWGINTGLQLAQDIGYRRVIPEVDSQVVKDILAKLALDINHNYSLSNFIRDHINKDLSVRIQLVHREANGMDDQLANSAYIHDLEVQFYTFPLAGLYQFMLIVINGVSHPRHYLV